MSYNSMSHVGLENDLVPPHMLKAMSVNYHYGWQWKGPEPSGTTLHAVNNAPLVNAPCMCVRADCGLVARIDPGCYTHRGDEYGRAKQIHKASECPGADSARLPPP